MQQHNHDACLTVMLMLFGCGGGKGDSTPETKSQTQTQTQTETETNTAPCVQMAAQAACDFPTDWNGCVAKVWMKSNKFQSQCGCLGTEQDTTTCTIGVDTTVQWRTAEDADGHNILSCDADAGDCADTSLTGSDTFDGMRRTEQIYYDGENFEHAFTVAGTYSYDCSVHEPTMGGTIVVQAE
jgi:plastocyanin